MTDGISLMISAGALSSLSCIVGAVVQANRTRKIEPQPLKTKEVARFVTCEECARRHAEMNERISRAEGFHEVLLKKLDAIEEHNEERAKRMHARIDPLMETVSACNALIKEHIRASTWKGTGCD